MRRLLFILGLSSVLASISVAQDLIDLPVLESVPKIEGAFADGDAYAQAFSNLTAAEKQGYSDLIISASNKFREKRIFAALEELYKADEILEHGPHALNLYGACYVEFRDFEKAEKYFGTVYYMEPNSVTILFNLAEISFVSGDWEECIKRIDLLLLHYKEQTSAPMLVLVQFKKMLALLKLGRIDEARAIQKSQPEDADNPFYYYAKAAFAFFEERDEDAVRAINAGRSIYGRGESPMNAVWEDTMIEFGYVQSFFGGIGEPDAAE